MSKDKNTTKATQAKKKTTIVYAKFSEIEQMYNKGTQDKNDNFVLRFITDYGGVLPIIISNKPTKVTEKNKAGLSRLQQLGFIKNEDEKGLYVPENYVKLKLFKREKGKTKFTKSEGVEETHKSDGLEIVSIEMSSKEIFEEQFTIFIANHKEKEIKELIKEGWDYNTSITHLKNKCLKS